MEYRKEAFLKGRHLALPTKH